MRATLSVLGLYNYDNTIFDNFHLPADLSKDTIVNNLMLELAEVECLYPNPSMMKFAIDVWSAKELPKWEKLNSTTKLEYNPLNNAYRDEKTTDTETRDLGGTVTHDMTTTDAGTGNETNYTSGFNDTDTTIAGKTDSTNGNENTVKGTVENTDKGTDTRVVDYHTEGSIGVVTPQNMIQQERAVDEFNIIDYIINDFKSRFCLLKY